MSYHFFNPETFLYSGSVPSSGSPGAMPPENSTLLPPKKKEGYFPAWNPESGAWGHVEDHRGEKGYVNGESRTIENVGELPDGWSVEPPEPEPVEPPPDTRTPEEKRQSAYRREADPVRQRIEGYRIEAEAWRLAENGEKAVECEEKANALLSEFLAKKQEIRERHPDEPEEGTK